MHRAAKVSIAILAAAAFAVSAGFAAFSTRIMRYDSDEPAAGDAVVVLTGGELRVREGLRLFENGAGRRLLISGVNRSTSRDDLRRLTGVAPLLFNCCVDIDYVAHDTIGNAAETRNWLRTWGFRRLVVVTSNYHMPRTLMELRRALPDTELVPHAVISRHYRPEEWWRHPAAVKLTAVEYLKYLRATGRWLASEAVLLASAPSLPAPPTTELSLQPPQPPGI